MYYLSYFFFQIIKRIYELSWDMFGDLPRGHHKNNSMHKLASKTMIEILPENLAAFVEKKCGSLAGKLTCVCGITGNASARRLGGYGFNSRPKLRLS